MHPCGSTLCGKLLTYKAMLPQIIQSMKSDLLHAAPVSWHYEMTQQPVEDPQQYCLHILL